MTHDALLGLLGLGARGGRVVLGVDGTRAALQREECSLVVLAADASPRAVEKVVRLARAKGATLVAGPEAELLGSRLGRPPVMVVGVKDRALAKGILAIATAAKGPDGGQ